MPDSTERWIEQLLQSFDEQEKMTEKQLRIVQAAVEVFAEKGFAGSSTSEIAQKAGVAEGTIFRHYKTKKDLLLSIVAPIMTKLIGPILVRDFAAKVLDAPFDKYEDFLRAIIRNRLEFVKSHLPIIRIMLQEIPFHPELREHFKEFAAKHVLSRLTKIVERYQKEGQIVPLPPPTVIRLCISTVAGFLIARFLLIPEAHWDDDNEIETTVRFIMHGLSPAPTTNPADGGP